MWIHKHTHTHIHTEHVKELNNINNKVELIYMGFFPLKIDNRRA